jgi:hypothetical protein
MKKTLTTIILAGTILGCNNKNDFSYNILDPSTNIEKLPFGSNTPSERGNPFPLEYRATKSELSTSVYLWESVGGGTNKYLKPSIKFNGDTAFLSFSRHFKGNVSTTLVNIIRLDYRVMEKGIKHLYFRQPPLNEVFAN